MSETPTNMSSPSKDDLVDNLLRIALEMRGTADAHLVGAAATNLRNAIRDRDEHLRGKNELVARVYQAEDRVDALEAVLRHIVDSVDKGILDARAFAWHARNALDEQSCRAGDWICGVCGALPGIPCDRINFRH